MVLQIQVEYGDGFYSEEQEKQALCLAFSRQSQVEGDGVSTLTRTVNETDQSSSYHAHTWFIYRDLGKSYLFM